MNSSKNLENGMDNCGHNPLWEKFLVPSEDDSIRCQHTASPLGNAAVVETADKKILVLQRSYNVGEFPGHFVFLGGHLESLAKLEAQVGKIANALSKMEDGKFPSQTEINLKNHEHLKAITTLTTEPEKVYKRMRQHGTVIDTSVNGPNENPKTVDIEPQDNAGQNEIDVNQKSDKKSTDTAATLI
ncbi:hypothetical protein AAC387_Pa03g2673 [Persea americana]